METLNIYTTTHTKHLAEKVISEINRLRGEDETIAQFKESELGNCPIETFANGEISCQYKSSIRDKQIYIFGETGTHEIMELLLMIDAAKRASAKKITVIIPCYGYARQDKKEGIRGPMGAKLVADILTSSGANSIIVVELHSESIQGFFNIPVNHINGLAIFSNVIDQIIKKNSDEYVVCSPDQGGSVRANKFSKRIGLDGAVAINKERAKPGVIAKMLLTANVINKKIILVDDMCDSAGTLCKAADYLIEEKGAKSVIAVCTHPVLSGNAIEKISTNKNLSEIYLSDTLYFENKILDFQVLWSKTGGGYCDIDKIKTISSSTILAKIISKTKRGESINDINK